MSKEMNEVEEFTMAICDPSINSNTISANTYTTASTTAFNSYPSAWINNGPIYSQATVDPIANLEQKVLELSEKIEHLLLMMNVLVEAELVKGARPVAIPQASVE